MPRNATTTRSDIRGMVTMPQSRCAKGHQIERQTSLDPARHADGHPNPGLHEELLGLLLPVLAPG